MDSRRLVTPAQMVTAGCMMARELDAPLWGGVQVVAAVLNGGIVCAHTVKPDSSVVETFVWNDRTLPYDVAPDKWALIDLINRGVDDVRVDCIDDDGAHFSSIIRVTGDLARHVSDAIRHATKTRVICHHNAPVFRVTDSERGVVRDADVFRDRAERLFAAGLDVWPHDTDSVVIGGRHKRETTWTRLLRSLRRMATSG